MLFSGPAAILLLLRLQVWVNAASRPSAHGAPRCLPLLHFSVPHLHLSFRSALEVSPRCYMRASSQRPCGTTAMWFFTNILTGSFLIKDLAACTFEARCLLPCVCSLFNCKHACLPGCCWRQCCCCSPS